MLYTTFRKVKRAKALVEVYEKFMKFKGGVEKWGLDVPFPLSEVLEVCGINDTIWCLRYSNIDGRKLTARDRLIVKNISIKFACLCAGHVLHFYEEEYPDDKRPRQAIEAAQNCIEDKSVAAVKSAWVAAAGARWPARAKAWTASAESAAWVAESAAWAAASGAWAATSAAESATSAADSAESATWAAWAAKSTAWAAWPAESAAWAESAGWVVRSVESAGSAARAAAWAESAGLVAWKAEIEWQKNTLLKLLEATE